MDGINSNFGSLSLGAAEWNPPQQSHRNATDVQNSNTPNTTTSDLNPGQVNEFIPGQGWTVPSTNTHVAISNPITTHVGTW
jgi:hypothetical protein